MKKKFAAGDQVVGVRDLNASYPGTVTGHDERGFALVQYEDGIPRAVPVESLVHRKEALHGLSKNENEGDIWKSATSAADYFTRLGEAEWLPNRAISTKEKK